VIAGDGGGRPLACPEESLIDLFLRKVPRLDLDDHSIDKFDFGLQSRFKANDEAIMKRNRLARLSRIDANLLNFVGCRGALSNSTGDRSDEYKCREHEQSDEAHEVGQNKL
jgi:hypothetical protein